jgi:hypothetical protein
VKGIEKGKKISMINQRKSTDRIVPEKKCMYN